MQSTADAMKNAAKHGLMIPAFNIPYLPMVEPVIRAVVDQDCFSLVEVARLEWIKFDAQSPAAVIEEFQKWNQPDYVRIHLDHVPVIDEDDLPRKVCRRGTGYLVPSVEIPEEGVSLRLVVDGLERDLILQALERTGWVKKQAAKLLGMNRTTLVEKMKKINLQRSESA